MDGMHDLGGRQGFGKVGFAPKASPFQAPWEKRAYALRTMAGQLGVYNIDEYRHAVERMDPRHSVSASYYERVITAIATLLVEKGVSLLEAMWLEDLAKDQVYEFLFIGSPLKFRGGTASPLRPIAIPIGKM